MQSQIVIAIALLAFAQASLCPILLGEKEINHIKGNGNVLVAHPTHDYIIVATDQGHIARVNKHTLEIENEITDLHESFTTSFLWPEGDALFLGTQGFPASVHRLTLSTFTVDRSVYLDHSEPEVSSFTLIPSDQGNSGPSLLVTVKSVPSHVMLFDINDGALAVHSKITLFQEENFANGATFNTHTRTIFVMTDSIPPHIVELTTHGNGVTGNISRMFPYADTPLPLIPGTRNNGDSGELHDMSTLCHSTSHGDRIFIGSSSRIFRVNTTFASIERSRANSLGSNYVTNNEMITWVSLNTDHKTSRNCLHDSLLNRLYVTTRLGLLTYNTANEPFGLDEGNGAKCEFEKDLTDGFRGLALDKLRGHIFTTSTSEDFKLMVHRFQIVPNPSIDEVNGVMPSAAPAKSMKTINIFGHNITDLFQGVVLVGFAKIRSNSPGETIVTEDPITFPATLISSGHITTTLSNTLHSGDYIVTIREHSGAFLSNSLAKFTIFDNPILDDVTPHFAQSRGGSLVTISGQGFINTGAIVVDFVCNGQHHVVNATFVSETRVTVRSPQVEGNCPAMLRVSLNGDDYVNQYAGQVDLLDITLTSIDPSVLTVKGDAEFGVSGIGFVAGDNVVMQFKPKGLSTHGTQQHLGFNTSLSFDEQLSTAFGKTLRFPSAGLYTLDLFMDGVLLTDGKLSVEVLNVTVEDFGPVIVSEGGGVDVTVRGGGFSKRHGVSVVVMPVTLGSGIEEIVIGGDINDDQTQLTFRLPHLTPSHYHLSLRISNTEEISFPQQHNTLTVHPKIPSQITNSPKCMHSSVKSHFLIPLNTSSINTHQLVIDLSHVKFSAKLLTQSNPVLEQGSHDVVSREFFLRADGVVNANSVVVVWEDDVMNLNVTAKLPQSGKTYVVFISLNDEEYHKSHGTLFAYEYHPQTIVPSSGPSSGNSPAKIEGSGHITQCGSQPKIRLHHHSPGRDAASWTKEVNARIIDMSTVVFQTPDVAPESGVVTVEVSIDGSNYIPMPLELPTDNYVFYSVDFESVSPPLASDLGGTVVTISGKGFPDSGSIAVKLEFSSSAQQIPIEWVSENVLRFTTPSSLPHGTHEMFISFNSQDWNVIPSHSIFIYPHIAETELGLSPVAGPIQGDTEITITLIDGQELNHNQLAVKFTCAQHSRTVELGQQIPEKSTIDLPDGGSRTLATYTLRSPEMEVACPAELSIARNGIDFHGSGHHFSFYDVRNDELSVVPSSLVAGQSSVIMGAGFVNSGDEMKIRFSNAQKTISNTITSALTFTNDSELAFEAPVLESLFTGSSPPHMSLIQISFNGQQWIDVARANYE